MLEQSAKIYRTQPAFKSGIELLLSLSAGLLVVLLLALLLSHHYGVHEGLEINGLPFSSAQCG